jgi:hypothetical protein
MHLPTRSDLTSRPQSAPLAEGSHQVKPWGFQAQFKQDCGRHSPGLPVKADRERRMTRIGPDRPSDAT